MTAFETLIRECAAQGATDVHLVAGQRPRVRLPEGLRPLRDEPTTSAELEAMARAEFGERRMERQLREGSVSMSFRFDETCLGRATLASTRGELSISARIARGKGNLTLERCNVPPVVQDLLQSSHGLIVVCGPHGSGKTTTLYALLEWINANRDVHVCTVEDPIEYQLEPKRALLQQREVGTDAPDMATGVAAAMHQDLDVLMLGGLANLESLSSALHAAETGHLVLVQLHAESADEALERIVEATPDSMHNMIRRALADTLRGVVAQRLLRKQAGGRTAVCEVLVPDEALRAAIVSGKPTAGIPGAPTSVSLRDEISKLEAAGVVDAETAERARAQLGR